MSCWFLFDLQSHVIFCLFFSMYNWAGDVMRWKVGTNETVAINTGLLEIMISGCTGLLGWKRVNAAWSLCLSGCYIQAASRLLSCCLFSLIFSSLFDLNTLHSTAFFSPPSVICHLGVSRRQWMNVQWCWCGADGWCVKKAPCTACVAALEDNVQMSLLKQLPDITIKARLILATQRVFCALWSMV